MSNAIRRSESKFRQLETILAQAILGDPETWCATAMGKSNRTFQIELTMSLKAFLYNGWPSSLIDRKAALNRHMSHTFILTTEGVKWKSRARNATGELLVKHHILTMSGDNSVDSRVDYNRVAKLRLSSTDKELFKAVLLCLVCKIFDFPVQFVGELTPAHHSILEQLTLDRGPHAIEMYDNSESEDEKTFLVL